MGMRIFSFLNWKLRELLVNFNKELIFGEIGALLGAPWVAFIASKFSESPNVISTWAVIGGVIGAAIVWLITRIWDQSQGKDYGVKNLAKDLSYFTPAALTVTVLVYYPTLFFLTRNLINTDHKVIYSVIGAQITAFILFLIAMNLYRYILLKWTGKRL
jgi:uncharacterized membrane protein YeaQ/YmgE (transglycosylase-associated protein family)